MVKFLEEIDPLSLGGEVVTKEEYEEGEDDDYDEDISYDELKKRMWKDRMRMQKLKSQKSNISITTTEDHDQLETSSSSSARQEEVSRRKKMSRAQDHGSLQSQRLCLWHRPGERKAGHWLLSQPPRMVEGKSQL